MPQLANDLWSLVWGRPETDPGDLAEALQAEAAQPQLDYRTRLLIRDSAAALEDLWGPGRWKAWLARCPARGEIEAICREEFNEIGFPSIRESLVDKTDPRTVEQLFRELCKHLHQRVRLSIGGSIALILPGYLARATTGIDVVDEVPTELRARHDLLNDLQKRYKLLLTHFASHYLPTGWDNRLQYFGDFGELHIFLVDPYDIFVGKLFSRRTMDLDDVRILAPQLEKDVIVQRLKYSAAALQKDPNLLSLAQQ